MPSPQHEQRAHRAERIDRAGRSDDGQATVLLLAVVVLAMVVIVAIGRFGAGVVDAARARTAADAAALAGAAHGRAAAAALASRNGGELESFVEAPDGAVLVTVRVHRVTARARATLALVAP